MKQVSRKQEGFVINWMALLNNLKRRFWALPAAAGPGLTLQSFLGKPKKGFTLHPLTQIAPLIKTIFILITDLLNTLFQTSYLIPDTCYLILLLNHSLISKAIKPLIGDDEMIQNRDIQELTCHLKLFCQFDIGLTRFQIT